MNKFSKYSELSENNSSGKERVTQVNWKGEFIIKHFNLVTAAIIRAIESEAIQL